MHRSSVRQPALGSRHVFLLGAAHDDLERVVSQRPLQRLRLIPRRAHPDIPFFIGRQDHRHRLRVDRLDHRVRRGSQEPVEEVRAGDWLRFGPTVTFELGPDAGEGD
jgi:hypothetical protein